MAADSTEADLARFKEEELARWNESERWKQRCREIMRGTPSRDACRVKLTNEGADPQLIPQVIDAIFRERKEMSREKQQGEDALLKRLALILDGGARCTPDEAPALQQVAVERARRLNRDLAQYRMYLLLCGIVLTIALIYLLYPLFVVFVLSVKKPLFGAFVGWPMLSAALTYFAIFAYAAKNYLVTRRRRAVLEALARKFKWWGESGPA